MSLLTISVPKLFERNVWSILLMPAFLLMEDWTQYCKVAGSPVVTKLLRSSWAKRGITCIIIYGVDGFFL